MSESNYENNIAAATTTNSAAKYRIKINPNKTKQN